MSDLISIAINLVAIVYVTLLPFKRSYHYAFMVFLALSIVGHTGSIWAQASPDASTFISKIWLGFAFAPTAEYVVLSTLVLLYLYPKPTRIQKLKLIIPYSWLSAYEALIFLVAGSMYRGPGRATATGWIFAPGWLRSYLPTVGGFNLGVAPTVAIFLGVAVFVETYSRYRVQKSPLIRRQMGYLLLGILLFYFITPLGSAVSLFSGVSVWNLFFISGELVLMYFLMRYGFYKVNPVVETAVRGLPELPVPLLEAGHSYLGTDPANCLRLFANLVKGGGTGLCITRSPPAEVRQKYGLESTPIKWLADSENRDAINPVDLKGIANTITKFVQNVERPVVLVDGLDYLASTNGFKQTMSLLERINKTNAQKGGIFVAASSGIRALDPGPALWESFDEAPLIQARVKTDRAVEVGKSFQLQLDLFNVGKRPVHVDAVEDLIPPQFKVVGQTGQKLQGSTLQLEGKRLEPFQLESSIFLVQASGPGDITINARVAYRDGKAVQSSQSVEPLTVTVLEPQDIEFETAESKTIFSFLAHGFVKDYMLNKQAPAESGWRSLPQISEKTKISRSTLYGSPGKFGRPVYELLSRGLIEERIFSDGKGRTGETAKFRISYDRELVRRHVDKEIAKPF